MRTISYNEVLYRAAEAAGRTRDNLPVTEATLLQSVFNVELARVWASEDWDDLRQPLLAVTLDANASFANPWQNPAQLTVSGSLLAAANGVYTGSPVNNVVGLWTAANGYTVTLAGTTYTLADNTGLALATSTTAINGAWTDAGNGAGAAVATAWTNAAVTFGEVLGVFDQLPTSSTPWQRLPFYRQGDSFVPQPGTAPWWGVCAVPATVYVYYQSACPVLAGMSTGQLAALTLPLVFGNFLALLGAAHLLSADGAASLAGVQIGLARDQLAFERTRIQRPKWAKVQ